MAQTFQLRIESLFGKTLGTTGNPSVADVNQWLEDAQWDIINKLRKSETEKLFIFYKNKIINRELHTFIKKEKEKI